MEQPAENIWVPWGIMTQSWLPEGQPPSPVLAMASVAGVEIVKEFGSVVGNHLRPQNPGSCLMQIL